MCGCVSLLPCVALGVVRLLFVCGLCFGIILQSLEVVVLCLIFVLLILGLLLLILG